MPTCLNCRHEFDLSEAPGAAGVTAGGVFIGDCPHCGYWHRSGVDLPKSKFTDQEVERLVIGLELAGDDLCQRVVDLLWLRNFQMIMM